MCNFIHDVPEIITPTQIACLLQISRRRVYELIQLNPRFGGIPSFDIGGSRRVRKEAFQQWLTNRELEKVNRFTPV